MGETKQSPVWVNMLTTNTYWVGLSFMWNSLHVILLPVILLQFHPGGYEEYISGMHYLFRIDHRHGPAAHQRGDQ